jgi:predicted dehydrogenase
VTDVDKPLQQYVGDQSPDCRWTTDWRELIADPSVDFVFICSESGRHDQQARAALQAGKHVCVEFPLTSTADQAESLWRLAERNDLVLHVEVIGGLTTHHQWTREVVCAGDLSIWSSHMTGGLYRWVKLMAQRGLTPLLAFGRLYQAVDLFETLKLNTAHLSSRLEDIQGDEASPYYHLDLRLESASGVSVLIKEERSIQSSRTSTTQLYDHQGDQLLFEPLKQSLSTRPLFELDSMHFLSMIDGSKSSRVINYSTPEKIIATHQLCDQLTRHLTNDLS